MLYDEVTIVKKFLKAFIIMVLVAFVPIAVYAADKTYKLKDIDLTVTLPEDLVVFTRETTASNPNYDYIDKEALALTADMEQKNIYLYAIDKDNTFDITVIATKAGNSSEDYNNCSVEELDSIIRINREDLSEISYVTLKNSEVYEHPVTKMIHYSVENAHESNGLNTVYIEEYDAVYEGFEYSIKLQSYGKQADDSTLETFKQMVDTLDFSKLSGSSVRTRILHEVIELLIGGLMVIAFLGLILFIMSRGKKNKNKHVW